ncbi:MAG: hypothetical protein SFX73_11400 [Kofleriaceae bacterium]|nr:hypothetical protein [Kofleriaceae bacterium]
MRSFSFLLATAALAACSPYDPDLGGIPYQCGDTEPKCPSGYSCQDDGSGRMVCKANDGDLVDARQMGGFVCQDDSGFEGQDKNDSISTAYQLPNQPTIMLGPVSICPEGDKDTYQVTISTAMSNIEAITTWESGMEVKVAILNSGGTVINNGTVPGDAQNTLRAYVDSVPLGIYYVQTTAGAAVKNNYKLTVKVTQ